MRRAVFAVSLLLAVAISAQEPPVARNRFARPSVKSFTPVTMTVEVANPNPAVMTNVAFTDSFPAFLTTVAPARVVNTCGGTVAVSSRSLVLTGGAIPAHGTCTLSVDVQLVPETPAPVTNILGTVTSSFGASQQLVTATINLEPELPVLSTRALMVMAVGLVLVGLLAIRA